MYSYKLNNSYTIYCYFPSYIHSKKKKNSQKSYALKTSHIKKERNPVVNPLPTGTKVLHKIWGFGEILSTFSDGRMIVSFKGFEKPFLYPMVFEQGFLQTAQGANHELYY